MSGDEEVQERVKTPVDETDSAEVVGSNPTGPTIENVLTVLCRLAGCLILLEEVILLPSIKQSRVPRRNPAFDWDPPRL